MPTLNYLSPIPYFLIVAISYFLLSKLDWVIPERFYLKKDEYQFITGIRGICAISVFIHHATVMLILYRDEYWGLPPSSFYSLLGQLPVAIFFSITGFLFWSKAIESKGKVNFFSFLKFRLKRIAPAYLVASTIILLLVGILSHFQLQVSVNQLIKEISAFIFGVGLLKVKHINGVDVFLLGTTVFWSLRYEWKFYLLLPLFALVLTSRGALVFAILVLLYLIFYRFVNNKFSFYLLFLPGILAAHIVRLELKFLTAYSKYLPVLTLLSLVSIFAFKSTAYDFSSLALLTILFTSLMLSPHDNILNRFLEKKPFLLLGSISYSLYLLHVIVLYIVFKLTNNFVLIKSFSAFEFWGYIMAITIVLLMVSILSYRYIEHPFLKK